MLSDMSPKLVSWLCRTLPKRPIVKALVWLARRRPYNNLKTSDGSLYMERGWIVKEGGWLANKLGYSVRLHITYQADEGRHLHNHPFDFRTFVLDGVYYEERQFAKVIRSMGSSYVLSRVGFHRIEDIIVPYDSVVKDAIITLFLYNNRDPDNNWGFLVNGNYVHHENYKG